MNLAARLQTGAHAGQVVISSSTYSLVRDLARVRPLGRFNVKGKSEEVEAFVLEASLSRRAPGASSVDPAGFEPATPRM